MALSNQDVVCTECHAVFNAVPKRSFLGFLKFICPTCSWKITYPLTSGYKFFYWALFLLFCFVFVWKLSKGIIVVPNLLGIGAMIALYKNGSIKKKVKRAQDLVLSRPGGNPVNPGV